MTTISLQNVTEHRPFEYTAEASSLGLRPGQWPAEFDTVLGNRNRFLLTGFERDGDEITAAKYQQITGIIVLKVFND